MLINRLLAELDERHIAQTVTIPIDEERNKYILRSNTATDFHEFDFVATDFYSSLFTSISGGGSLPTAVASSRAKEIIEKEYRKKGGDIVMAFNDAHDGTNGGMRAVLDMITEGVKAEVVESHIRNVFDKIISPNDWDQKVDIIRQFISQCGHHLSSSIKVDQPERYASNYTELIRNYVNALQRTSSIFRRL